MSGQADLAAVLDRLCPMHLILDASGHVAHAGPTARRLRPPARLDGARFLELFELRRPRGIDTMRALRRTAGQKLHLQLRDAPRTGLKGVAAPLQDGGAVVDLGFGISVLEAVGDYALTGADFAATDPTVEMLYLVEAKSAAMAASRTLNLRLQGAMIAAEEQAFTDTLTGLKNRRAFDHVLARLLEAGVPFALMHLDLDHFKAINDTMGHAAGDTVLQQAARVMVAETRQQDTVARVGGDEFMLIFHDLLDEARLMRIATRLIERLEEPVDFEGMPCRISASIGILRSPGQPAAQPDALVAEADAALYEAKRAGRGRARMAASPP